MQAMRTLQRGIGFGGEGDRGLPKRVREEQGSLVKEMQGGEMQAMRTLQRGIGFEKKAEGDRGLPKRVREEQVALVDQMQEVREM